MNEALEIALKPLAGSGMTFAITERATGVVVCHCTGPRVLVIETLARWVTLFGEESVPHA